MRQAVNTYLAELTFTVVQGMTAHFTVVIEADNILEATRLQPALVDLVEKNGLENLVGIRVWPKDVPQTS